MGIRTRMLRTDTNPFSQLTKMKVLFFNSRDQRINSVLRHALSGIDRKTVNMFIR